MKINQSLSEVLLIAGCVGNIPKTHISFCRLYTIMSEGRLSFARDDSTYECEKLAAEDTLPLSSVDGSGQILRSRYQCATGFYIIRGVSASICVGSCAGKFYRIWSLATR
jgi:hypothetical protein